MCQASFDRTFLKATQYLKHKNIEFAQEALKFLRRYSDDLPQNIKLIIQIENGIQELSWKK